MNNVITEDIQRYLNGEGEFEGKPVLVVNGGLQTAAGQIYSRLSADDRYGFAIGKGLVKLGSDRQWRPLSFQEWDEAIRRIFVFAKFQESVGAASGQIQIIDEPPKFFLIAAKQGRWSQYAADLFPCDR